MKVSGLRFSGMEIKMQRQMSLPGTNIWISRIASHYIMAVGRQHHTRHARSAPVFFGRTNLDLFSPLLILSCCRGRPPPPSAPRPRRQTPSTQAGALSWRAEPTQAEDAEPTLFAYMDVDTRTQPYRWRLAYRPNR